MQVAGPTRGDPDSVLAQSGDIGGFPSLSGFSVGIGRGWTGAKGLGKVIRKKGWGEVPAPGEA